jgi:hypothetical protein
MFESITDPSSPSQTVASQEMRGHTSYINHCCYTVDGMRICSSGSDGWVKVKIKNFKIKP